MNENNPNIQDNQNVQVQKKSYVLPIVIVVILLLVIIVGVLITLLVINTRSSNNIDNPGNQAANNTQEITTESTTKTTSEDTPAVDLDLSNVKAQPDDDKERSKNLEFKNIFYSHEKGSKYGYAYLLFMNNNNEMVDTTIYINFYKDGQRIGSEQGSGYNIKPNHLFVDSISVYFNEEYDSYDITYSANKSKSTYDDLTIDKTKIKTEKKDEYSLESTYPRKYDKESSYWAYILYKKDGKVVFCENSVDSSLNTTDTASFKFFLSRVEGIEYDSYEVDIYSASKRVDY